MISFNLDAISGTPSFNNTLVDAADSGDKSEVIRLLKKGANPDSKGDFGVTPLMRAAFRGNVEIAELLIKSGAYVNASDIGGDTPLHMAARGGNSKMVKLLLHYDAHIDAPDNQKWTPLMRAIMSKSENVTEVLVDRGADLNVTNNVGNSALVQAAISGKPSIVKILLSNNNFKTISGEQRQSSINVAEKRGYKKLSKLISSTVKFHEVEEASNRTVSRKIDDSKKSIVPAYEPKPEKNIEIEKSEVNQSSAPIVMPVTEPSNENKKNEAINKLNRLIDSDTGSWGFSSSESPFSKVESPFKQEGEPENKVEQVVKASPSPMPKKKPEGAIKYIKSSEFSSPYTEGIYTIQIGAYSNEGQAMFIWERLKSKHSRLLSNMSPSLLKIDNKKSDSSFYRLRVGAYNNKMAAKEKCLQMQEKKIECFVVKQSNGQVPITNSAGNSKVKRNTSSQKESAGKVYDSANDNSVIEDDIGDTNFFIIVPRNMRPVPIVNDADLRNTVDKRSVEVKDEEKPINIKPVIKPSTKPEKINYKKDDPANYLYLNNTPNESVKESNQNKDKQVAAVKFEPTEYANPVPIEEELPWLKKEKPIDIITDKDIESVKEGGLVRRDDFAYSANSESQKEHDYSTFYKDIKKKYAKRAKISEAILVEQDNTLPWLQKKKQPVQEGIWIEISSFPNRISANDYADRMFKYDEELRRMEIKLDGGTSAYDTRIRLKVGPFSRYGKANMLCNSIKAGGLKCIVSGTPTSKVAAAPILPKPKRDYVPRVKKLLPLEKPVQTQASQPKYKYWINLGAFSDYYKAEYYWAFLSEDNSDIVKGVSYQIDKVKEFNGFKSSAVKLKAGPFYERHHADNVCGLMRQRNISCLVMK